MVRRAENDKAEDAVYKWFIQKCSQGQPISGLVLCEKALIFGEKLVGIHSSQHVMVGWEISKLGKEFMTLKFTEKRCLPTLSPQMILFSNLKRKLKS